MEVFRDIRIGQVCAGKRALRHRLVAEHSTGFVNVKGNVWRLVGLRGCVPFRIDIETYHQHSSLLLQVSALRGDFLLGLKAEIWLGTDGRSFEGIDF